MPVEPSPQVRERILSEVRKDLVVAGSDSVRSSPTKYLELVWFAGSDGGGGALYCSDCRTCLSCGARIERSSERDGTREFVELVTTPGARVSELKRSRCRWRAQLRNSPTIEAGHAILMASKLPSVPQGKAYQLWFIVGNKPPMPGKTFVPDSAGKAVLKDQLPREALDLANVFAITVEPAAGSTAPTSPDLPALILAAKLTHHEQGEESTTTSR